MRAVNETDNESGTPLLPMGLGRSNGVPGTQHLREGRDGGGAAPL